MHILFHLSHMAVFSNFSVRNVDWADYLSIIYLFFGGKSEKFVYYAFLSLQVCQHVRRTNFGVPLVVRV